MNMNSNAFLFRKSLGLPARKVDMLVAKHEDDEGTIQSKSEKPRKVENEDPLIHCIAGMHKVYKEVILM